MPALSSNFDEGHPFFLDVITVFLVTLLALVIVLIRRKLLFGSIFISASQCHAYRMSNNESSESEKAPLQFRDEEYEQMKPDEGQPLIKPSSHARSLSSQLPPPTIKPYLAPLSSASNAEYFSNSPITETPSTFTPSTTFSPPGAYSQSTSFSEAPESSKEGPTRRRSYTKTLSLPLPNQPILHPSAHTAFPTPTSHPAPNAFIQPGGPPLMYMPPTEAMVEVEVQGEIIVAEGWRRHTRVFGGGVCKACEESKSKEKQREVEVERRGTA